MEGESEITNNIIQSQNDVKKSFKLWTVDLTNKFLDIYEELVETHNYPKRKLLWIDISKRFLEEMYNITPIQCENRWKSLLRIYNSVDTKHFHYNKFIKLYNRADRNLDLFLDDNTSSIDNVCNRFTDYSLQEHNYPSPGISPMRFTDYSLQEHNYPSPCLSPNSANNSKIWTNAEVRKLIDVYSNFYDKCGTKRNMWDVISTELQEQNVMVTADQCQNKWKTLLRVYKKGKCRGRGKNEIVQKMIQLFGPYLEDVNNFEEVAQDSNYNESTLTFFDINDKFNNEIVINDGDGVDAENETISTSFKHQQTSTKRDTFDDNNDYHNKLLIFLREKEMAKQKRHEENLQIKKRKLELLEIFLSK